MGEGEKQRERKKKDKERERESNGENIYHPKAHSSNVCTVVLVQARNLEFHESLFNVTLVFQLWLLSLRVCTAESQLERSTGTQI